MDNGRNGHIWTYMDENGLRWTKMDTDGLDVLAMIS